MSEHLRGAIHQPVLVHLCPQTIVRPRYTVVQLIFVKVTVHPALHMMSHGDNREKGVGCQVGDDMGCSCAYWEIWWV